jgi:tryptophan synthase alpha chain
LTVKSRPALEGLFRRRVKEGRKLLVPYLTAGLPSPQRFVDLVGEISHHADALEVGFPFSDPVMDGPVIQQASITAIEAGMTAKGALSLMRETVAQTQLPAIAMSYFNPIHLMGLDEFVEGLERAGAAGLIVPDLPYEEGEEMTRVLARRGIASIQLIGPTTSDARIARITDAATGFIYAVSRLGVTGERDSLHESATPLVERIRRHTELPVLLGVGISTTDQASEAATIADGVIIGTAFVKPVLEHDLVGAAGLIREMRKALDKATARNG